MRAESGEADIKFDCPECSAKLEVEAALCAPGARGRVLPMEPVHRGIRTDGDLVASRADSGDLPPTTGSLGSIAPKPTDLCDRTRRQRIPACFAPAISEVIGFLALRRASGSFG